MSLKGFRRPVFVNRQGSSATQYAKAQTRYGMAHPDPVCLWLADMDIAPPACVFDYLSDFLTHSSVGYQQVGIDGAVRAWFAKNGAALDDKASVIDVHSIIGGLHLALSTLTPASSKVMVLTPTYPPIAQCIKQAGRQVVAIPYPDSTDESLTQTLVPDASALVLCHPNNPTGRILSDKQRADLMRYCDSHDILILSDEAHADFFFSERAPTPWSQLVPDAAHRVIQFVSPNKTFNLAAFPGASYAVIGDKQCAELFTRAVERSHMEAGGVSKVVLNAVYEHGESWLRETKAALQANRQWATAYLQQLTDNTAAPCGEAGYFCWFNLAALLGVQVSEAWTTARDKGVLVADGAAYGKPGYARMTLATSPDNLQKAFHRLV